MRDLTGEAPDAIASFEMFRDGQDTLAQSSVTVPNKPDTANGCLVLRYAQEPRREAQPRVDEQAEEKTRRSPEREANPCPT
jgi:hypothetical protein